MSHLRRASTATPKKPSPENDKSDSENKCGSCPNTCKDNEPALQCELCCFWHHIACENVSKTQYIFLSKHPDEDNGIHWYCRKCNKSAAKLWGNMTKLEKRQDALEVVVNTLNTKVDDHDNNIKSLQTKVDDNEKSMKTEVENQVKIAFEKRKEVLVRESVREASDRTRRKNNVIIFNLEESKSDTPATRLKEDNALTQNICKEMGIVEEVTIRKSVRLGKKKEDSDENPRPLRVELESVQSKNLITREASKLSDHPSEEMRKIFIKKDMTPLERQEWKDLAKVKEARQAETAAAGEDTKWMIKDGAVVKDTRPPKKAKETIIM